MWWRRSWFSLKGKAGIPGQTEGCPATSIGPRVLPGGSLQQRGERGFDGSTAGPPAAFESDRFEHAPFGRQAGRRDPPQRAGLRRCSRSVFVRGHWPRTSLAPARTYSAATGVVVFVKLGGRFSR